MAYLPTTAHSESGSTNQVPYTQDPMSWHKYYFGTGSGAGKKIKFASFRDSENALLQIDGFLSGVANNVFNYMNNRVSLTIQKGYYPSTIGGTTKSAIVFRGFVYNKLLSHNTHGYYGDILVYKNGNNIDFYYNSGGDNWGGLHASISSEWALPDVESQSGAVSSISGTKICSLSGAISDGSVKALSDGVLPYFIS